MNGWIHIAQAAQAQQPAGPAITDMIWFFALILIGYYFLIVMPQKKERKERQQMLDSLAKGDQVITSAGIHGKVTNITKKGDIELVTLECSKNVQIDFSRAAITTILKKKGGTSSESEPSEKESSKKGSK